MAEELLNKRILIVDDDLELCQVILDTLRERGFNASFVQSAEEAWDKIHQNPPDLILLDLEIPHMGGFVLCQKLQTTPQTQMIPIVFLTVRDSDFDKRTAMSLGASRYITKPFRRSHLLSEVTELLMNPKAPPQVTPAPAVPPLLPSAPPPSSKAPAAPPQPPSQPGMPDLSKLVNPAPAATPIPLPVQPKPAAPAAPRPIPSEPAGKQWAATKSRAQEILKQGVEWSFKHKAIAIPLAFVFVGLLTWGSMGAYRKLSGLGKGAKADGKADAGVVAVNVMQIAPGPFQDVLTSVGTVAGGSEIELRFQTEGKVASLNFREGDSVRAGQVIAKLDQNQAMLRLERAKSEFFRYEKLYALGGVSKDRLDEARIQYEYAQAEIDKTVLKASLDGILGDRSSEVGEFVTPQKKIGTLVSLNSVLVRIGVIEKEIDKIAPGQQVVATVDTYPNMEFKGKVENISPLVQGQSKTLTVEARIPNSGKLLLPGMFARTRIVIYENDHVISVPNDALEKTQEGYKVFVVGQDAKAEVRPVEVSYVSLTHSVVSNGLAQGDQVIVQRPQELKAGSPLKIIEVEKAGGALMGEAGTETPDGVPIQ